MSTDEEKAADMIRLHKEAKKLKADNTRLRTALEKIYANCDVAGFASAIAREALKETK